MNRRRRAPPYVAILSLMLAIIGLSGVVYTAGWSKNLYINGTVQTGTLDWEWKLGTLTCTPDTLTTASAKRDDESPFLGGDISLMHVTIGNAYPGAVIICNMNGKNIGTIKGQLQSVDFLEYSAPFSNLTGCTIDLTFAPGVKTLECNEMDIEYDSGVLPGVPVPPGFTANQSMAIMVKDGAQMSTSYTFKAKTNITQYPPAP